MSTTPSPQGLTPTTAADAVEPTKVDTIYRVERFVEPGDQYVRVPHDVWWFTGELSSDKGRALGLRDKMAQENPEYVYRVVGETTTVTNTVVR